MPRSIYDEEFLRRVKLDRLMAEEKELLDKNDCRVWKLRLKEIEPKWIPVSERLPENNNQWVLCLCVGGAMEVLKFDYTMRNWDSQYPRRCYIESYVTHWMPLPKPPQENENGI